jgi:regulator of sigma E protease
MSFAVSILVVGLLIAFHELGHFIAARKMGMKVLRFSLGFGWPIISRRSKKTDVVYQVGALPLGGFVQIKGMNPFEKGAQDDPGSYQTKPVWRRFLVVVAGPLANFLGAWALLFGLYLAGLPEYVDEPRVGETISGGPADRAGIQADDLVLALNRKKIETWHELASGLHQHPDEQVELEIERDGQLLLLTVTPEEKNGIGLIGIRQPTRTVHLPLHIAAWGALVKCVGVVAGTLQALFGWIGGTATDVQPVGPVGIVKLAAQTLQMGARPFLALTAYLSLMLFLFNLLPIPALDGGRGVFLLYELISRRRVSKRVDLVVNATGFILLMGLILIVTAKEIFAG